MSASSIAVRTIADSEENDASFLPRRDAATDSQPLRDVAATFLFMKFVLSFSTRAPGPRRPRHSCPRRPARVAEDAGQPTASSSRHSFPRWDPSSALPVVPFLLDVLFVPGEARHVVVLVVSIPDGFARCPPADRLRPSAARSPRKNRGPCSSCPRPPALARPHAALLLGLRLLGVGGLGAGVRPVAPIDFRSRRCSRDASLDPLPPFFLSLEMSNAAVAAAVCFARAALSPPSPSVAPPPLPSPPLALSASSSASAILALPLASLRLAAFFAVERLWRPLGAFLAAALALRLLREPRRLIAEAGVRDSARVRLVVGGSTNDRLRSCRSSRRRWSEALWYTATNTRPSSLWKLHLSEVRGGPC